MITLRAMDFWRDDPPWKNGGTYCMNINPNGVIYTFFTCSTNQNKYPQDGVSLMIQLRGDLLC